jgi:nicotinamidase-related amidase
MRLRHILADGSNRPVKTVNRRRAGHWPFDELRLATLPVWRGDDVPGQQLGRIDTEPRPHHVQQAVDASGDACRCDDIAFVYVERRSVHLYAQMLSFQLIAIGPVRGDTPPVQQARRGNCESAKAKPDQQCAALMRANQRRVKLWRDRLVQVLPARHDDNVGIRNCIKAERILHLYARAAIKSDPANRTDLEIKSRQARHPPVVAKNQAGHGEMKRADAVKCDNADPGRVHWQFVPILSDIVNWDSFAMPAQIYPGGINSQAKEIDMASELNKIDPARRALIVVDVQNDYNGGSLAIEYPPFAGSLANITRAMDAAHANGVKVVVVKQLAPETSRIFAAGSFGGELHVEIASRPRDHYVEKNLPSAFGGTDLEAWLRANQIEVLTVVGYMTHNCDFSTIVHAVHHGFAVEFLNDATGAVSYANSAGYAPAEEIHRVVSIVLESRFAAVISTDVWLANLETGSFLKPDTIYASNQRALAKRAA